MSDAALIALDDRRRYGVLLAGPAAEMVAYGLVAAVALPSHPHRLAAHDYLGLTDLAALPPATADGVRGGGNWSRSLYPQLLRVGATARIAPEAWLPLSIRPSDAVAAARVERIAQVLSLPRPVRPTGRPPWWSRAAVHASEVSVRVLAAAGPLSLAHVERAVMRTHSRMRGSVAAGDLLVAVLIRAGARRLPLDGRWALDGPVQPADAELIAATLATGRLVHTFDQVRELLGTVGQPAGRVAVESHPLIEPVPVGYVVLGAPPT